MSIAWDSQLILPTVLSPRRRPRYGPPEKHTVVIFSERADAVTAGVLTKETFFLFATIQTSISCVRVESLHRLDHHVEYLSGTRSSNTVGAGTGRRPPARQHSTGLLADHAYYTAALQPVAYLGGARRRNSERVGTCVLGGILGCPERFGLLVFHNAKNAGLALQGLLLHDQHVRGR